ncbi:hypothetical protein K466DRAFT_520487 [Polyporus arcularius HHB13444]|uniref:RNA polymerase II subunit A C-terminal domain phosphatase n=1 Tax=Polyporus arcularius HHB13444 TaxID=1314778 RepID=A0A5C3PFY7_9APHY|nr:hypothetical protein K466DRAFT_520487 [Polyporus arcularius HHB13444]
MSSPSDLYLPPSLPYPIKVVSLAVPPDADVHRGTRLLDYSFTHTAPDARPELRFGTWDSPIEGTLSKWSIAKGDVISQRRARESPALQVLEPCKHGVQLGGLCCLCGKDMTSYDYTGFSDASRASIQMTHLANGPLVSLEEAQRIEQETAQHLIRSRKLSLIVDLDQTIVHATVDPTVGEWIAEGEAWEARQAKKAAGQEEGETEPGEEVADADDEVNPNWEALKDVKKFRLGPEALGQPHQRNKGKKHIEQEGCMYYIKPRPGLLEFLQTMATKYEMHVYTMGTRAYAEEVCAAIDPGGKIFGNRILSRDESGSLTQKSLQRLFPCDQSMVVIIDDRADVWEWSPNLVKVIPYDFFVGIGDINSAFLPKLQPLVPVIPPPPAPTTADPSGPEPTGLLPDADDDDDEDSDLEEEDLLESTDNSPSNTQEDEVASLQQDEMLNQNTLALEAQFEERPLAKKQEELQHETADEAAKDGEEPSPETAAPQNGDAAHAPEHRKEKPVRKALLKNDDSELVRVKKILDLVHERFYAAFDARKPEDEQKTPKKKHGKHPEAPVEYDVRTIIPRMRSDTLAGCRILFTSVVPAGMRPEATDIWKTATAFGAECYTELTPLITHVVAAKLGTEKIYRARKMPYIKIVWVQWLNDSIALWQRQDETPYLIEPEPPSATEGGSGAALASPHSDPQQISSDPEPDADDWDVLLEGAGAGRSIGPLGVQGPGGDEGVELDDIDWNAINDEVDAAMNESDDDGDGASVRSGKSDDEGSWTDETNSVISSTTSTPRLKRKRVRSITPSDTASFNGADSDALRSPLAKRKKLALERSGASRLKEGITAEQLKTTPKKGSDEDDDSTRSQRSSPLNGGGDEDEDDDDGTDGGSEYNMVEDDFLARELEEEWG